MIQQNLNGAWQFRKIGDAEWAPAVVPGGVHTDLLALGRIPDPFVADNENAVQWIAESDWEYRLLFYATPALLEEEKIFLVCNGLDTLAEVWLNGQQLGETNNMFRQYRWQGQELLHAGENELRIVFRSPLAFLRARQAKQPLLGGGDIPGGPHLRKAPYQWGWDWGPKLPPIGIWRDVRLEGYTTARLEDIHLRQHHGNNGVTLQAAVRLEQWQDADLRVVLQITPPDGEAQTVQADPSRCESKPPFCNLEAAIRNPQLWWPNGYGAQPLYEVNVSLWRGEALLDWRVVRIGLRTLELRREPDEWGESFQFVVNGTPIFAKGANWIPADSFPTRVNEARLEWLIRSAAEAHMNMLRAWGGGYYPEDRFYDLCDRYGLLVWQDFIFACGIYPDDKDFFENVRQEAIEAVRRLRHHPSLALWCGNVEMEQGWVEWQWDNPTDPVNQRLKAAYDRMFHHLLPAIVAEEDPDRPYWPSSPSSGIPFDHPNGQQRGDTHYWEVWHGRKPFTAYRQQYPRFMSEFGFQSLPPLATIQTYAPPEEQNITSYIMEHHQRSGSGNGLIVAQMTDLFRLPTDFSSFVYVSMVLQAEGIRYGVEHWRRNRRRVGGTLYWQLNDCWPVASWSSIDYFGRWKALHYLARRFYAPLLLSIEENDLRMDVHLTNDMLQPWQGKVAWRLETLQGQILEQAELPAAIAPQSDTLVCSLDFSARLSNSERRRTVLIAELWQGNVLLGQSLATFVPNKHLMLTDPCLQWEVVEEKNGAATTRLWADSLARFVELSLEGADAVFSDNYFDLSPNRERQIQAPWPDGWDMERLRQALRVRSLYNSYA